MTTYTISDQPLNWFLQFSIQDMVLTTIPPQYVFSFKHSRTILDNANTFELVLYYEGSSDIEDAIAETGFGDNCYYRYGIVGGNSTGVYRGSVVGYNIEFLGGATQLTIQGISQHIAQNQRAYSKVYKGTTIDQYVINIAKDNGMQIGLVEPCVPILTSIDNITGQKTHKVFHQLNTKPLIFILEELVPYAVSSLTGLSGYHVYTSGQGNETLNFCTPQFQKQSVANYIYYAGPQSNIISWTPEIIPALNVAQGGGQLGNLSMNSLSNELQSYYHTDVTTNSMPLLGSKNAINKNIGLQFLNTSSSMEEEMQAKAKSLWMKNANLSYQSTMVTPLDVTTLPNQTVDVLIMNPSGQPHYTTGTYLVMSIEDMLDSSGATSTFTLIKNAVGKGTTDAVGREVQSPKPAPVRPQPKSNSSKPPSVTLKNKKPF